MRNQVVFYWCSTVWTAERNRFAVSGGAEEWSRPQGMEWRHSTGITHSRGWAFAQTVGIPEGFLRNVHTQQGGRGNGRDQQYSRGDTITGYSPAGDVSWRAVALRQSTLDSWKGLLCF